MEIGPVKSISIGIITSILLGLAVAIPLGLGILGALAIAIVAFGISSKGFFQVPYRNVAVLTFLGARTSVLFTEGWNMIIPFITGFELVDLRENVWEIPDPIKEPGKDGFTFMTGVRAGSGVDQAELKARAVLRFKISDPNKYLSNSPDAIMKALRAKVVDEIRERGAHMSAADFIADKQLIADEVKRAVDSMYDFVEVTGLDIAKADYADPTLKNAEQGKKLERARTLSQEADMLGDGGTAQRIAKVAQMLIDSGLSKEQATLRAIDIIQTQEGRMTYTKTEFVGGSNPFAEAASILKGMK
jgi:regulator of protease activity HflC (stomatin/prohibitin superfamily)